MSPRLTALRAMATRPVMQLIELPPTPLHASGLQPCLKVARAPQPQAPYVNHGKMRAHMAVERVHADSKSGCGLGALERELYDAILRLNDGWHAPNLRRPPRKCGTHGNAWNGSETQKVVLAGYSRPVRRTEAGPAS